MGGSGGRRGWLVEGFFLGGLVGGGGKLTIYPAAHPVPSGLPAPAGEPGSLGAPARWVVSRTGAGEVVVDDRCRCEALGWV